MQQIDDFTKELVSQLKDAYKENIDLNFKVAALTVLVIGWFTASKNPLQNLCELTGLAVASPLMTVGGYIAMMYFFNVLQRRSQGICDSLQQISADAALYQRWRISRLMLCVGMLLHLLLFVGISYFLWNGYVLRNACPAIEPSTMPAPGRAK